MKAHVHEFKNFSKKEVKVTINFTPWIRTKPVSPISATIPPMLMGQPGICRINTGLNLTKEFEFETRDQKIVINVDMVKNSLLRNLTSYSFEINNASKPNPENKNIIAENEKMKGTPGYCLKPLKEAISTDKIVITSPQLHKADIWNPKISKPIVFN
jgi:hypothetical protein